MPANLRRLRWPMAVLVGIVAVAVVATSVVIGVSATSPAAGEVVAEVNGTAITRDQLYQEMLRLYGPATLGAMIDELLVRQEAERRGVRADAQEVEGRLRELEGQFGSLAADDRREALRRQIETSLLLEKLVGAEVEVTEEEARRYFEEHRQRFDEPEQVHARHILVQEEATAKSLLERLQKGEDFATLAQAHSIDAATRAKGGDLGFVPRGSLAPELEQVAFALQPGQVGGPVRTADGYHLVRVEERRAGRQVSFEEVRPRVLEELRLQKIQERLPDWLGQLRNEAVIRNYLDVAAAARANAAAGGRGGS